MNTYLIITTILSIFFLIVVSKLVHSKWKQKQLQKAFDSQRIEEKELKRNGLKPFSFLLSKNKPVQVWGRSYKDASLQFEANKKGGVYGSE